MRRIPPAEATENPWWAVVDPVQMMEPTVHAAASMVTGPFFSRERAQQYLEARRYDYSDRAAVYCFSGYRSQDWREFCEERPALKVVQS